MTSVEGGAQMVGLRDEPRRPASRSPYGTARAGLLLAATASWFVGSAAAEGQKLGADEQNTVTIYRAAARGVVHINASTIFVSDFERSEAGTGVGTGFVIDTDGRIITAYHVIADRQKIEVVLADRTRLVARVVGTAPRLDIALLQVDAAAEQLHPLELGDSDELEIGQKVIAIGNPIGLHNAVTVGVVSGLNRSGDDAAYELRDALIQTDASLNPGNSGGPLLDSRGRVVGINAAVVAGGENVGLSVPINMARRIIPDLVKMGHPYHPQVGFTGTTIDADLATLLGLPTDSGVLVQEVLPGSAAAWAGLRAGGRVVVLGQSTYSLGGDIIVGINDKKVRSAPEVSRALLEMRPGQVLRLKILRAGSSFEISIPLDAMRMSF